jgi:hypothetical protein
MFADASPWLQMLVYYLLTVSLETPVLLVGLSVRHGLRRRLFAGFWLTACTYPIVFLVLPPLFDGETRQPLYVAVAETFAPVAECVLFWIAFGTREEWGRPSMVRDFAAIVAANLTSFGIGEVFHYFGWLG